MANRIAKIALINSEIDIVIEALDRRHRYLMAKGEYDEYKKIEKIRIKVTKAVREV